MKRINQTKKKTPLYTPTELITINKIMETNKLPEDFKKEWIAALRSGEYKQGHSKMYNGATDTYCCLGVAYKLTTGKCPPENGYIREPENGFPSVLLRSADDDADTAYLLASMNDGFGYHRGVPKSFSEIADYIEQNL